MAEGDWLKCNLRVEVIKIGGVAKEGWPIQWAEPAAPGSIDARYAMPGDEHAALKEWITQKAPAFLR